MNVRHSMGVLHSFSNQKYSRCNSRCSSQCMLRITPQNLPLDIIKDPANFRQLSASFLTSYLLY